MNEILSIVLCFVSGVVVASVVMAIFEMRNKINGLTQQIKDIESIRGALDDLYRCDDTIRKEFNRDIEHVHREINTKVDEIYREINTKVDEIYQAFHQKYLDIYRYIDSRHDKLENKLVDITKNGCEPVKSK